MASCMQKFCWKAIHFPGDHRSLLTRLWKKEHHISSFTWPAQSPDINVIENVLKVIKVHVQKDLSCIKSRQNLIESVLKAWSKLHRTYIRQLCANPFHDVFVLLLHRKVLTKY